MSVKKVINLDLKDSINSVVQTIDCVDDLICYGGYDKVLKLIQYKYDDKKNYENVNSFYMEGLPILNASFIDKKSVALNFLKKKFISFLDIESKKSSSFYKLFKVPMDVELLKMDLQREKLAVTGKNEISLLDCKTRTII